MDNIVIAQEVIHSLQRKTGRKGGMVIKVDLEKAYDRIVWPFLQEVILAVSFNTYLTELILSCISSTSLTVLWNGKILKEFKPKRGLRQGDLLSRTCSFFVWRCWDNRSLMQSLRDGGNH